MIDKDDTLLQIKRLKLHQNKYYSRKFVEQAMSTI